MRYLVYLLISMTLLLGGIAMAAPSGRILLENVNNQHKSQDKIRSRVYVRKNKMNRYTKNIDPDETRGMPLGGVKSYLDISIRNIDKNTGYSPCLTVLYSRNLPSILIAGWHDGKKYGCKIM